MLTLYKTMVLPHLEYTCQLWCPNKIGDIRKIEAVQRTFTSKIYSVRHLNYWDRLRQLNLFSLERRRERYLLIYAYKIIQNIVPNIQSERYTLTPYNTERRGRLLRVPPLNMRSAARIRTLVEGSFSVRAAKLFNCLSPELRNFEGTVEAFKAKLDAFLNLLPDKPQFPGYHQRALSNSICDQIDVLRNDGIYL